MDTMTGATGTRLHTYGDLLDLYWREIKDNPPLSRERELELFARVRQDDTAALHELVEANLRFVVSVAREYCHDDGPTMMDLIAEGNMGLLRAIRTFDETRGFKFITYAVWWIRQAMRRMLATQHKALRIPASHVNDLQLLEREASVLSQQLGRAPSLLEVAEHVSLGRERICNAMDASLADMSLDAPAYADDDTPMLELLPGQEPRVAELEMETEALNSTLRESLSVLSQRELGIVQAYFGLDGAEVKTLEQIGQELGVTRERVRQLRNRALDKMRRHYGDLLLELSAN